MQTCHICLEEINTINCENKLTLECYHTFHKDCIKKLINYICPLCRSPINIKKTFKINK